MKILQIDLNDIFYLSSYLYLDNKDL